MSSRKNLVVTLNPARTAERLTKLTRLRPTLAIGLGSGFGHAITRLRVEAEIPYAKLPGFPRPGIGGHSGKLLFGHFGDAPVCVLSGRARTSTRGTRWRR